MEIYVELHARSAFSFLRGASLPGRLVTRAAKLGLSGLAICDRNGFYGSPRQWTASLETGVHAIYGCELTLEDGSVLPVLVRTTAGYQSLCRLLTRSALRAPKGLATIRWDELEEVADGVICLTGDEEGPIIQALLQNDLAGAEAILCRLTRVFGPGNVYAEVQRHLRRGERWLNARLANLAQGTGTPLLATGGVLYAEPVGRRVLDVFTCARLHTSLDQAGTVLSINGERHLKSPAQMRALFADLPEAVTNTARVAERIEFAFPAVGYEFPTFEPPDEQSPAAFLRRLTYQGARRRYGERLSRQVRCQLEKELALIEQLGFTGYFLLVWDIVRFCEENAILIQGRGSAANSAVCYCLGITVVDPIGSGLLFERFLNENRAGLDGGRRAWPDIDLDLPSGERRERVIQEMYRRYGRNGVGMTANVITFKGRSTMREVGKAMDLPADVLDRFSSLFHSGDFPHTLELQDQFERCGLDGAHPRARACLETFQTVQGLPRHLGQHSGGMVFCQGKLDAVVHLENCSMPSRSIIAWDKDDCEELGLVKVDLLGLGMMAAIQDTLEVCRARGRDIDLAHLPKDDAATYDAMCASDTVGVFQVESRAQMATLARLQPRCFYDVAVQVAVVRPGPIDGGLMHPYLARRQGAKPVTYLDERLRPILERTLGVCMFQEQMMAIAMTLAGFTGAEVDELRRALNDKRDPGRLERINAKLRAALEQQGLSAAAVTEVVAMTRSFALYGFPESHAISFGLLAYASTYLKVHRPAEFLAGLLNNQPMGFYGRTTLIGDARRHGIRVLSVCVGRSDWPCSVEADQVVRLGFNQVKRLRREPVEQLLQERAASSFRSLDDFCRRVALPKETMRSLARLGAFNIFGGHRRSALWAVEREIISEEDLFAQLEPAAASALSAPLRSMTPVERVAADCRTQGFTTGPHPMALLRGSLPRARTATEAGSVPDGSMLTIAGAVICRQRPGTAKGFVFISLEDETGIANAVVPSELFEAERLLITQEPFLLITGPVQTRRGLPLVRAQRIERLQAPVLKNLYSHDFH